MIDETKHTFQVCLDKANERSDDTAPVFKKHLMLGNGFSIALRPDIFGYESLAGLITTPEIINLFAGLGTKDFEHVMHRLTDALEVVNINSNNSQPANQMQSNLNELRTTLIDAISKSHPDTSWDIDEARYRKCHNFLSYFDDGNKYTFNYDLLLYWVYMKFRFEKLTIDDGFRGNPNLTWDISQTTYQNVYYLHGAMHLFDDNKITHKLNGSDNTVSLKDQVCRSIRSGKYPMFISEGTKDHKFDRIEDCIYLKHAFDSLDKINDNLFIFGHSLDNSDDHVFNKINRNTKLKNIFISIFDDITSDDNQRIVDKVKMWAQLYTNKNYYFYDAVSADVWGTP